MATSGTVTYRPNIEELIDESFERCGLDTQTRTGGHVTSARRSSVSYTHLTLPTIYSV